MSIASRQMFLEEAERRIGDRFTVTDTRDAMRLLSDVLSEYEIEYTGQQDDSSSDFVRAFLDAKEIEGRSKKTIDRYDYVIRRMLKSIKAPIRSITTYHLRAYLMDNKNRGISDNPLEGIRNVMNSFFGWLWREGMIERNPCANIGPIKIRKQIRLPFSAEEMERIKEACHTMRDKALVSFLLSTGCRISEVCGLNRDDIDFVSMECTVLGKGNKERTVYIDSVTAMLLKRYFKSRADQENALFIGKGTDRMTPGGVRARLKTIEQQAGVENVHPHRFRRTLATNLINRGMPIQEVAAILGHDKIDTTMKYVFVEKENVKSAYRKYA